MKIGSNLFGVSVIAAVVISAAVYPAVAWEPTEEITLVSQSSAGTGNDLLIREVSRIWVKNNMIPVPVRHENVTGAQGENARRYVSSENAGNTHLLYAFTPATLNQAIISNSEYTYDKFTPLVNLTNDPGVIVINTKDPWMTMADMLDAAKEDSGSVIQGGGPYGGGSSILGKLIGEAGGVELPYTPFKGGGDAITALLGGHIDFVVANTNEILSYVEAGKMRVIGVSEKLDAFPDVATFEEQGLPVEIAEFRLIVAPPGIPQEVQDYYIDLLKRTVESDDWKEYAEQNSLVSDWQGGAELKATLDAVAVRYRGIDERMGLLK
jgi:putative tricarboxylic transport membrane protein